MANPDFSDESVADQSGAGPITVNMPAAWAANQIALLFVASDGGQAVLSTANGYQLATDPAGNQAFSNAGTGVCGITVFWKRLVGSTLTTDPAPVIAAASTWGGTSIATHINTYTGCRTSGTPFHKIATNVVSTATTAISAPSVTTTLNGCTLVTSVASENDDSAFNAWTFTGAASPAGILDNGWHSATGNAASFAGGRGGYATAGGPHNGTSTFGASTRQAQITMVLASLAEPLAGDDDAFVPVVVVQAPRLVAWSASHDDLGQSATSFMEDDAAALAFLPSAPVTVVPLLADDEIGTASVISVVTDEDPTPVVTARVVPPPVSQLDDSDQILTPFIVDDETFSLPPPRAVPLPLWLVPQDDEQGTPTVTQAVDDEERRPAWFPVPTLPPQPLPEVVEIVPQAVVAAIGGAGDAQRSLNQPPQTGTLTTTAPVPAWTTSHAYVVDPTGGGIHRVVNAGTLYQCSTAGTSASTGPGPTSTTAGATVVDGTAHWYVLGPSTGTDTIAGSQILAAVMRGTQSFVGASIDPSDNDSGAFTVITNNAYAGFPQSFAGVWRRSTASNAKTSYQASALWGGSGGAGDEQSVCWVELQGVKVGAPHASSQVERAGPTGGTVTAAPITITKRCMIVSFWFGNGTTQTAGTPDAATPTGGLTLIAGCTGPLSLTANGYIQHMVAWRMANPGTYSEVWSASPTSEGAQLVTVAFEDLSAGSIAADDDAFVPWMQPVAVPYRPSVWTVGADEVVSSAVAVDDEVWMPRTVMASAVAVQARAEADEVAVVVVDEEMVAPIAPVQVARPVVQVVDDEIAAPAVVQDHETIPAIPPARLWLAPYQADIDDITAAPLTTIGLDDDGPLPQPVFTPAWQPVAVWLDDVLHGIARGHVQIPGSVPDPEVYDYTGALPIQELYGGH